MKQRMTLQSLIILLMSFVVFVALGLTNWLIAQDVAQSEKEDLANTVRLTSQLIAESTVVKEGLAGRDSAAVQVFAERVRTEAEVDYITVFTLEGIRLSHPDPSLIGQPFAGGDEGAVLSGKQYLSTAEGTLGTSIRYFMPVYNEAGTQIGAVATGITLNSVEDAVSRSRQMIYAGLAAGLVVGLCGAVFLSQRVKRILFDMEPASIARLLNERSVMLASTHEGIIAVDRDGLITLLNDTARHMLQAAGLGHVKEGDKAETFMPTLPFPAVLHDQTHIVDQEINVNGTYFFISSSPLLVNEQVIGAVATLRDRTEMKKLAEKLSGTELYAEALRAQTHEFMNRLHVIFGMLHMKQYEALSTYIHQLTTRYQDHVGYIAKRITDPVIAGFLLAKMSGAAEQNKSLVLSEDSFLPEEARHLSEELITILGNLIDNALDATKEGGRPVTVYIGTEDDHVLIEVKDHGAGMTSTDEAFQKGKSSKGSGRGYGLFLVQDTVEKGNGTIHVLSEPGKGTIFDVALPLEKGGENG